MGTAGGYDDSPERRLGCSGRSERVVPSVLEVAGTALIGGAEPWHRANAERSPRIEPLRFDHRLRDVEPILRRSNTALQTARCCTTEHRNLVTRRRGPGGHVPACSLVEWVVAEKKKSSGWYAPTQRTWPSASHRVDASTAKSTPSGASAADDSVHVVRRDEHIDSRCRRWLAASPQYAERDRTAERMRDARIRSARRAAISFSGSDGSLMGRSDLRKHRRRAQAQGSRSPSSNRSRRATPRAVGDAAIHGTIASTLSSGT